MAVKEFFQGQQHLILLNLLLALLVSAIAAQTYLEKVVIDNKATIKGLREQDSDGAWYYSFRGIPYAEPPVGENRWKDPILKPAQSLDGLDATKYGSKCLQWSRTPTTSGVIGSEDCLFLNIFTRNLPEVSGVSTSRPTKPVIFYIHAGGYMFGSSENVGTFRNKDVVFVSINYRLGVLGFLSTNDTVLPGNYGLLDQIVALEWVNVYIKYFGGNERQITIMGHSAGAGAVHALTLSPLTNDLFSGAIIQSGSALCDWFIEPNPREYAVEIGEAVDCQNDEDGSQALVDCLKMKNGSELISAQQSKLVFWVLPLHTAPIVDGGLREFSVLPATPQELMKKGNFSKVPLIVGVTQDEGLMGYAFLHLLEIETFENNEYFHTELIPKVIRNIFSHKNEKEVEIISKAVEKYYFEGIDVSNYNGAQMAITEMSNLFGDTMFYSCHWNMLESYASSPDMNVYNYVFSYKRNKSPKILGNLIRELRQKKVHHTLFDYGIPHGEDMFYVFHPMTQFAGNEYENMNDQDLEVATFMTRLWVSFATYRVPTITDIRPQYPGWRKIISAPIPYYIISGNRSEMGSDFRKGEALFWLRTIPLLQEAQNEIDELEAMPYELLFWIFLALSILFLLGIIALICVLYKKHRTGKATL